MVAFSLKDSQVKETRFLEVSWSWVSNTGLVSYHWFVSTIDLMTKSDHTMILGLTYSQLMF